MTHVLIAVTVGIHLAGIANPTWQAEMFEQVLESLSLSRPANGTG